MPNRPTKQRTQNLLPETRPTEKRERLANLFTIPRKFKMLKTVEPEFEPVDPRDTYTLNQLIFAIGSALPEMGSFVKEHDVLRNDLAEAIETIKSMHYYGAGYIGQPIRGVVEDVEKLRERFNRLFDVAKKAIYHPEISGDTFDKRKQFMADLEADITNDSVLVNERRKHIEGNGSDEPTTTDTKS